MNNSSKSDNDILNKFIDYLLTFNKKHEDFLIKNPNYLSTPFRFDIEEGVLLSILDNVKKQIIKEDNLLNITAPIYIFGDIHGQYADLLRFLEMTKLPPKVKLLFLGDYVDRGDNSIEVLTLIFALKIKFPNKVFMIRGNHECSELNESYGFKDECLERYKSNGNKIWNKINECLHNLSISALINKKIFCVHGGISMDLEKLEHINNIQKGTNIPNSGLLCDLTWSDPKKHTTNFMSNDRGVSYTFNEKMVDDFCKKHEIDLVCRAHQVVNNGYKFFSGNKLVTVFSAPNYCGEVGNSGSVMKVSKNLECSFLILKPIKRPKKKIKTLSVSSQE